MKQGIASLLLAIMPMTAVAEEGKYPYENDNNAYEITVLQLIIYAYEKLYNSIDVAFTASPKITYFAGKLLKCKGGW